MPKEESRLSVRDHWPSITADQGQLLFFCSIDMSVLKVGRQWMKEQAMHNRQGQTAAELQ